MTLTTNILPYPTAVNGLYLFVYLLMRFLITSYVMFYIRYKALNVNN
jgi:hypothetical protein